MGGVAATVSAPRVYLAGPEVFLRDPHTAADAKRALCRRYGFAGVFPLDAEVAGDFATRAERGFAIHAANERLIRSCQLLVANLTPFRGPSADVGAETGRRTIAPRLA